MQTTITSMCVYKATPVDKPQLNYMANKLYKTLSKIKY